jgi:ATP-dependent Clp protease ATP-binding subunit ClpC
VRRAGEEARELRHSFVGTEHILLALARETDGSTARALAALGISHARVRSAVLAMIGPGVDPPEDELLLTGPAEHVIERARAEASIRDQPEVGTEHILLALIREPTGAAARILLQLDADPEAIRSALAS